MRKHLTLWIMAFVILIAAGTGFSTWMLMFSETGQKVQEPLQDDIMENYSFSPDSNKYVAKEYTIYLFPSTVYLNDYLSYLEGATAAKPEEIYGYIEPEMNAVGKPVLDSEGAPSYSVSEAAGGDEMYLYTNYLKSGAVYTDTYAMQTTQTEKVYSDNYSGATSWSGTVTVNGISTDKCNIGDPELDATVLTGFDDEQYQWRNHHRFDRFGYWYSLPYASGRYLPLKITVNSSFSADVFNTVSMTPYMAMGDGNNNSWFDYTFPCWTYVEHDLEQNTYILPSYATALNGSVTNAHANALNAFHSYDLDRYFDMMHNFEKYADADGIIRLFPVFYNGKNYGTSYASQGGRDPVHMKVTPADPDANTYCMNMFCTREEATYSNTSAVKLFQYPNIDISQFSDAAQVDIQIALSYGVAVWWSWAVAYSLTNDIITEIIQEYGDGLYNFFVFVGNSALDINGASSSGDSLEGIASACTNPQTEEDILFSNLVGRNLITLENVDPSLGAVNIKTYRPMMLCVEKIEDIKLISDIANYPAEEDIVDGYTATNSSFRYINQETYQIPSGSTRVDYTRYQSIVATNPYSYILSDVDFTEAKTMNFQIRFMRNYSESATHRFSGTGGSDPAPDVDIIYNPASDGSFTKEQRFVNAFGTYFDVKTTNVDYVNEIFFTLKSEEMMGIYDFILIYHPVDFTIENDDTVYKAGFYVYVYRHTNIFVKILANDVPDQYQSVYSEDEEKYIPTEGADGFADHKSEEWQENQNVLIFQKEYPIGTFIRTTDINEVQGVKSESYGWDAPISKVDDTLAVCVDTYVDLWLAQAENAGKSRSDVVIRDHVTGATAAYYDEQEQLTFEPFKIRKNYIFYLTWK